MNTTPLREPGQPERPERSEHPEHPEQPEQPDLAAQLRALIPPPAAPGLPRARRNELEAHFVREITGAHAPAADTGPVKRAQRLWMSRRAVSVAAAAGVMALTIGTVAVSASGSQTAYAAPAPLKAERSVPAVPLARVAERAAARADGPGEARRGSHVKEWALGMWVGGKPKPPVTSVYDYDRRWSADGGGTTVTKREGHPTKTEHYPAGSSETRGMFHERPPADPSALRDYLARAEHDPDVRTHGYQMADAVGQLLLEWTPGPKQTAAIVEMLAERGDIRARGAVVDRLGRQGQMYTVDGLGARQALILNEHSGKILGVEMYFTRDDHEVHAKAGDVMQYDSYIS